MVEASDDRVELELANDLATPVSGASVFSLRDCEAVRVDGGRRMWRRRGDGRQDLKVAYEVPTESTLSVAVECCGG